MKDYLKKNKIEHIIFFISIFLIIIFSLLKINSLIFLSCSITTNLFLIEIIKYIKEKLNIVLSRKEKIFFVGILITIYIFYTYSIVTRKFIYYWDFSCYYDMQMQTIDSFKRGLIEALRFTVGSTWSGEYGNFLSFFPQVLFNFTNKSINSYIISVVLVFTPYVFYSFILLLKTFEKYILPKEKWKKQLFYLSLATMTVFPLLHGVLLLGQPDYFGLTFIFLIISFTLKYDFKKLEVDRLIIIFLLTFMLTICRRWYIYWIVTYYFIYITNILLVNIKDKKNLFKIIKNMIIYGIIVIILYLITLFPFIKNTLLNNYSSAYSFYSFGGPYTEILNQINHLGILMFIIVISGLIYGIINKKYRRYSISVIIQYLLIVILFTKIQNLGLHHSLQLLIFYFYGIYMFLICIENNEKNMKQILLTIFLLIIVFNFIASYNNISSRLFTDINLNIQDDENYDSIKKITKWLDKNLDKNNTGYLITHNNKINPDKLRNFKTPNSTIKKYVPYGSAVIGVHKFPLELFTAKYVMTTNPFENISIEEKYNKVFKELINEGKFKLVKSEKLKDNITFEIYERVERVDEEEKNKYLDSLKEESKKFKNLYEDIINSYKIN